MVVLVSVALSAVVILVVMIQLDHRLSSNQDQTCKLHFFLFLSFFVVLVLLLYCFHTQLVICWLTKKVQEDLLLVLFLGIEKLCVYTAEKIHFLVRVCFCNVWSGSHTCRMCAFDRTTNYNNKQITFRLSGWLFFIRGVVVFLFVVLHHTIRGGTLCLSFFSFFLLLLSKKREKCFYDRKHPRTNTGLLFYLLVTPFCHSADVCVCVSDHPHLVVVLVLTGREGKNTSQSVFWRKRYSHISRIFVRRTGR